MRLSTLTFAVSLGLAAALPAGPLAPRAQAQSLNAQGVARLNQDAQSLWAQDGLVIARTQAQAELQKLVGKVNRVNGSVTATVTRIRSFALDAPVAPGLTRCDGSRIEGRLPLTGKWKITASCDLRVQGRFLGINVSDTFAVTIVLDDISAAFRVDLDSADPAAPRIVRVVPPVVSFRLSLGSSSWVMNFLGWLTSATVNSVADVATRAASSYLTQKLNMQWSGPVAVWGSSSTLAPVAPIDLEGGALAMERTIERDHRPFGSLVEGTFDRDYRGTWEQSFADPQFTPGSLDLEQTSFQGDSALGTGYYLAALSFRYGATRSPEALAHARSVLGVTRTLLTMRGEPGNLNRSICPRQPWMNAANMGSNYFLTYNGVEYVMSDYVSRDAYTGIFTGLSVAYDMLDAPADKQNARQQIEMAIDYLLRNNWTWRKRDGSWGERWAGALEHQYAWVLAAYHVNPAKYQAALDAHKGYADLVWMSTWTGVFDTYYSYYKFSLINHVLYTALRLESDPVRWQRAYQGVAILRRYIGHHQQAQFNNCYLALDPSSKARLGAENANLLARLLRSPRRFLVWNLHNDATIAKGTYTVPFDTNLLFPNQGVPRTVVAATTPIPVEKRVSTGYRWSRSPFALGEDYAWGEQPRQEGEGVDLVLPYWMARYYGAIPAPRTGPVMATAAAATFHP